MDAHKLQLKIYATPASAKSFNTEAVIPVFHRWIKDHALPELTIDVANYGHVPEGDRRGSHAVHPRHLSALACRPDVRHACMLCPCNRARQAFGLANVAASSFGFTATLSRMILCVCG